MQIPRGSRQEENGWRQVSPALGGTTGREEATVYLALPWAHIISCTLVAP